MKKRFKRKSLLVTPQDEPGVADLINKVQQQLSVFALSVPCVTKYVAMGFCLEYTMGVGQVN